VAEAARVKRPVRALILAPTRELAAQIGESLREDAQHLPVALKIAITYGGVSINPQMMRLRGGADIVVATPGRLLDLIDQNAVSIADVQTLVLDEADRLLDLGFADELKRLLALLPASARRCCSRRRSRAPCSNSPPSCCTTRSRSTCPTSPATAPRRWPRRARTSCSARSRSIPQPVPSCCSS
jgi:ATP-dependent RNA helicase RhlE